MKARIVPLYFKSGPDNEFFDQLRTLKEVFAQEADIIDPIPLGAPLPEADAVIFPQILGDAYKQMNDLKRITIPILVVTSEFGTVAMWDWEVVSYLRLKGLTVFAPYHLELTRKILKSLALKREMRTIKFLVFQDDPGEGMQASIFKRFYWWENECTELIKEKFGITIVKKSFKKLAEEAKNIPDFETESVWKKWALPIEGVSNRALLGALKMYIALEREIEKDNSVKGMGINCLNESFYSDTTPCLAWNMLFEEKGIIWACEADTLSLLTQFILFKSLNASIMMSNIYPFLMGMAALKHEKIDRFPEIKKPEDHLLVAHCGYLGVLPKSFSTEWKLKPRVLEIVNENATAIDARLPKGEVTIAKIDPALSKILVIEGYLEGYVQYPGSDCRNGAIIRIPNGLQLMNRLYSHHNCIITGHHSVNLQAVASILELEIDEMTEYHK